MKNLLILSVLLIFSFTAMAQSGVKVLISSTNATAVDTVVNTGVRIQKASLSGAQDVVTVVATITKISGIVGGTLICMGSLDDVNYVAVDATSFTPADVAGAQSFKFKVAPSEFPYYQIRYTGAGTMSASLSSKLIGRK